MDLAAHFSSALTYTGFLDRYATAEQRRRWDDFHAGVLLTAEQQALLGSFTRDMPVLVIAGAWCGDCVNQCPIFERFAAATSRIQLRFADRDDAAELTRAFPTCGGARVPTVLFLSEDFQLCGRYGDRTLAKYRDMIATLSGAACPTGLVTDQSLTQRVVQEWLDQFERVQWMLRTSARLRQAHGD